MPSSITNKYCTICGEPLASSYRYCPSCGASNIKPDEEKQLRKKEKVQKNPGIKDKSGNKKSQEFPEANKNPKTVKVLSGTKLFYIFFFLIILSLLIIYSSGIISDAGVVKSSINQNDVKNQNSSVDLQHLQQINSLEELVKNNPSDKIKLLELAHLLNDSGFKERAIEKYQLYLKTNPKESDVLVDLGVCYYETGKNDEAMKWMKEALIYQPKHQIAHLNLGVVYLARGAQNEAIDWWKKAVEIDPKSNVGKRAQEFINSH